MYRVRGKRALLVFSVVFAQNVGIGTSTPSQRLVVAGNIGLEANAAAFVGTLDPYRLELRVHNQISVVLQPSGTTAPAWSLHRDGGDTRGIGAVDWQYFRANDAQVASGNYSVIAGGRENRAAGTYAVVGGGYQNTASDSGAVVAGGLSNRAYLLASVLGGVRDTANAVFSFVGGGLENRAGDSGSDSGAVVVGGWRNRARRVFTAVVGGYQDTAWSPYAFVGGGYQNRAGDHNTLDTAAAVLGGWRNRARGRFTVVVGGKEDTAYGRYSIAMGGYQNRAGDSFADTGAVIAGGWRNKVDGNFGAILGGVADTAVGTASFIGCGMRNRAGQNETDTGAIVVGGIHNRAMEKFSAVLSGSRNVAVGNHSVIIGGSENSTAGSYVLIFGRGVAAANESYRVFFFDSTSGASGRLALNRRGAEYPIHVGTNGSNGNGAYLSAGGAWTNASSRAKKERFKALLPQEVLQKIRALRVEGWYYKGTQEYHIGPCAEDFHDAFGTGVLDGPDARTSLAASDVAGVGLLGIQALAQQNEELRVHYLRLEAEVQRLSQLVEKLQAENLQLRQTLKAGTP